MKVFNFDRYVNRQIMAEGVRVHANNLVEATQKAENLFKLQANEKLVFINNKPCFFYALNPCCYCYANGEISHEK